jgi:tellurite resistance protein
MDQTGISFNTLDIVKLEAFVELMFLAAYADGQVQPSEREVFKQQIVAGSSGQLREEVIELILRSIERALASGSREIRFEAIRRRLSDPRMRMSALQQAVAVLRADGDVGDDEVAFLLRAAHALEISDDDALALLNAE